MRSGGLFCGIFTFHEMYLFFLHTYGEESLQLSTLILSVIEGYLNEMGDGGCYKN